jgi:hypothetical protein
MQITHTKVGFKSGLLKFSKACTALALFASHKSIPRCPRNATPARFIISRKSRSSLLPQSAFEKQLEGNISRRQRLCRLP